MCIKGSPNKILKIFFDLWGKVEWGGINIYSSGTFFIQLSELAQRHEETELTLKNEIQLLSMGSSEKAEKIENLVKELNVLTGKLSQVKLCDTGWLHFFKT